MAPTNQGVVTDVVGDLFTALFEDLDVLADFERALCPDVQVGDVLVISATGVRRLDLGRWTQAEIDSARAKARRLAAGFAALAG